MSWSGAMTTLQANLALAAADVSPTIPLVRQGEPDALNQDTIAYWAAGTRPSTTGGNTFTKVNIERGVTVIGYLRGATRAAVLDAATELRLVALEEALFIRLWADADLGGNAIGIAIEESTYGWIDLASQLARTVSFTVWIDLPEVATISL